MTPECIPRRLFWNNRISLDFYCIKPYFFEQKFNLTTFSTNNFKILISREFDIFMKTCLDTPYFCCSLSSFIQPTNWDFLGHFLPHSVLFFSAVYLSTGRLRTIRAWRAEEKIIDGSLRAPSTRDYATLLMLESGAKSVTTTAASYSVVD